MIDYQPDNPLAFMIRFKMDQKNIPYEIARDLLLIECLEKGEVWPFGEFLVMGETPGKEALQYLGLLLDPGSALSFNEMAGEERFTAEILPFELKPTKSATLEERIKQPRGKRESAILDIRDEMIALAVDQYQEENGRGTYAAALSWVASLTDGTLSEATVKAVYDKWRKKQVSQNNNG